MTTYHGHGKVFNGSEFLVAVGYRIEIRQQSTATGLGGRMPRGSDGSGRIEGDLSKLAGLRDDLRLEMENDEEADFFVVNTGTGEISLTGPVRRRKVK